MKRLYDDWLVEFAGIHREMERFLNHYAGSKPPVAEFAKWAWEPEVDVYETVEEIVVIVDLAGVDENQVQVLVDQNRFTITGKRSIKESDVRRSYHIMEIARGPFERTIKLPASAEVGKIEANHLNGLLEIRAPKRKPLRRNSVRTRPR